jgi:hypothetical protein
MFYDGDAWRDAPVREDGFYVGDLRVAGPRQGAIAAPSGGAAPDNEARSAIGSILAAMRSHGLIEP